MSDQETLRQTAERLAAEKYPKRDAIERGYQPSDYVTDGQHIGFVSGYLAGRDNPQTFTAVEVDVERERQVELGYTQEHDDKHGVGPLLLWSQSYARKGKYLKAMALVEAAREVLYRREYRDRRVPTVSTEQIEAAAKAIHAGGGITDDLQPGCATCDRSFALSRAAFLAAGFIIEGER